MQVEKIWFKKISCYSKIALVIAVHKKNLVINQEKNTFFLSWLFDWVNLDAGHQLDLDYPS